MKQNTLDGDSIGVWRQRDLRLSSQSNELDFRQRLFCTGNHPIWYD